VEEPKAGFFDTLLNTATNMMKNVDLQDGLEMAKFALEAGALLMLNKDHGYVNRNA